jgi:hypothetical protein
MSQFICPECGTVYEAPAGTDPQCGECLGERCRIVVLKEVKKKPEEPKPKAAAPRSTCCGEELEQVVVGAGGSRMRCSACGRSF